MGEPSGGPVTTVIARRVKPGCEAAFEDWAHGVIDAASAFPGHEGVTVLKPRPGGPPEYVLIVRFSDFEALCAWDRSEVRAEWLERVAPLSAAPPERVGQTGLETWFTLPGAPAVLPPSPPKMAALTFVGIYPLVLMLSYVLTPMLREVPVPLRTLVMCTLLIPMMTWVVMPRLTRLFWPWLHPGLARPGS